MARLLLISFLLVVVGVSVTAADRNVSPLETFWHAALPNTTIPDPIRYLIDPELDVTLMPKRRIYVRNYFTNNGSKFIMSGPLPEESYIRSIFFPKSNMKPGTQMNEGTNFTRTIWGNVFVPQPEADAIPFSTKNFPKLLNHFHIALNSKEAKYLQKFVVDCEEHALVGETKFCPASLESMIDNVVSLLGTHDVHLLTTTINASRAITQLQKVVYRTTTPVKSFPDHAKFVICHPEPFVQAVHYCHTNTAYKGYIVPLIGNDGSTVDALTICHHDMMNVNKGFFKVLKMKPGSEPICHFLPENHVIWIRNDEMPASTFGSEVHY